MAAEIISTGGGNGPGATEVEIDAADVLADTEVRDLSVPADMHGWRIDKALATLVPELSRSYHQQLMAEGAVSLDGRLAATGDATRARAEFVARQPMGRIGEADEIADLALYLAGATYTTGQAVCIDGGWTI